MGYNWNSDFSVIALQKRKGYEPGQSDIFLKEIYDHVKANLDDPGFDIIMLAERLHLSVSQLFRRIKALTCKSTAIYIRSIRLQVARELLRNTLLSIAEIAYKTGFNDPSYFTRCFCKEFGSPPGKMRK